MYCIVYPTFLNSIGLNSPFRFVYLDHVRMYVVPVRYRKCFHCRFGPELLSVDQIQSWASHLKKSVATKNRNTADPGAIIKSILYLYRYLPYSILFYVTVPYIMNFTKQCWFPKVPAHWPNHTYQTTKTKWNITNNLWNNIIKLKKLKKTEETE